MWLYAIRSRKAYRRIEWTTAAMLILAPGVIPAPAAAADNSIEPAVDQICGAIENVCSQTCYSNDPSGEYPALTDNCIDNCNAQYQRCVGDYYASTKGGAAGAGGVPSGGAVLDAGPRKPNRATGQTDIGNGPSGNAVFDSGAREPVPEGSQGIQFFQQQ